MYGGKKTHKALLGNLYFLGNEADLWIQQQGECNKQQITRMLYF